MVTIRDVAKLAGVSPATVSRAINGLTVTDQSAIAVRAAVRELNFTPNRIARTLRRRTSEVIALVVPDIQHPYFTEIARGAADAAADAGYALVLCNTDSQIEKEAAYFEIAVARQMAGVLLIAASDDTNLDDVLEAGRPVVAIDRPTRHAIDEIVTPGASAARAATAGLARRGYRRIACITASQTLASAAAHAEGYSAVVASLGTAQEPAELLRSSARGVDGGRESMESLLSLQFPPDSIVIADDLLATGALQMLAERGLMPPTFGVAVIGALRFTTLSPRAIHRVRVPARRMGHIAATTLLARIGGDGRPPRRIVLASEVEEALSQL